MNTSLIVPIELPQGSFPLLLSLNFSCLDKLILTRIQLDTEIPSKLDVLPEHIQKWARPLTHYFSNISHEIEIPHCLISKSDFQSRVLLALKTIPYGETVTYGELAEKLNTHPRAIGQALKSNPLPLIYPCHRVVSKVGLGGFMGKSRGKQCDLKLLLLQLENNLFG